MKTKKDNLGDRMKGYENISRTKISRRTYTMIRIDGKCFSNYTKGLEKPFDNGFVDDMNETAIYLCKKIQGAKCAFVQSDEISVLLTDFETVSTDAWFDGNIQKMSSISASMATAKFNQLRLYRELYDIDGYEFDRDNILNFKLAEFDARVFQIPQITEVENYFIWRQNDTTRNSISSLAQSMFSHHELEYKTCDMMQEMCFQKGCNWNDLDPRLKRGRMIKKESGWYEEETDKNGKILPAFSRPKWKVVSPPIFTKDRSFLNDLIPVNR